METGNKLNVYFDEYPRYKAVEQVLDFYRRTDETGVFHVLEIGSNEHKHLRLFLPRDNILFTDVFLSEKAMEDPEFQLADGTNLPFEDNSFDFVVATDVLEHIPRERRELLLSEVYRVGRLAVILTFPYASEDVVNAEMRVNQYYKALSGEENIWLKQHAENELPELSEVNAILNRLDCKYLCHFRGDLRLWERLYYSYFDAFLAPESYDFYQEIDSYYKEQLYAGDVFGSCYRAIYVLSHAEIAPLDAYLKSLQGQKASQEKLDFLDTLFTAQRQIYSIRVKSYLQNELAGKQAYINALEAQSREMDAQWKMTAERWEKDVGQWRMERSQWETERAGYENRLQISANTFTQNQQLIRHVAELQAAYDAISNAFFWKLTKPLRIIFDAIKRPFRSNKV